MGDALLDMRQAPDPRILLEVALVKITRVDADVSPTLAARAAALEAALAGGAVPSPPSSAPAPPPPPPRRRHLPGGRTRTRAGRAAATRPGAANRAPAPPTPAPAAAAPPAPPPSSRRPTGRHRPRPVGGQPRAGRVGLATGPGAPVAGRAAAGCCCVDAAPGIGAHPFSAAHHARGPRCSVGARGGTVVARARAVGRDHAPGGWRPTGHRAAHRHLERGRAAVARGLAKAMYSVGRFTDVTDHGHPGLPERGPSPEVRAEAPRSNRPSPPGSALVTLKLVVDAAGESGGEAGSGNAASSGRTARSAGPEPDDFDLGGHDVHDLDDAPDAPSGGLDAFTQAFPGAELVDGT